MAVRARLLLGTIRRAAETRAAAERLRRVRSSIAAGGGLEDKVALVTGGGSGIGLAVTAAFARAGAHCILVALDVNQDATAVEYLTARGLRADVQHADITDDDQVRAVASRVAARFNAIDILVNNAGVFLEEDRAMRASQMHDEVVSRTLAVNLYGTMHVSAAFSPLLRSGSRIINVSSVMGQLSRASDGNAPAYRLSKAALNSYAQSLAAELKGRGVMVDCVHPGWAKTAIGGPRAEIDPEDATDTIFYLATRPQDEKTGLFWWDCKVIPW